MGNFVKTAIVACLAGTVLLWVSPQHALGQAWTTSPAGTANIFATVDISNGTPTNLTASGSATSVADGNSLAFGAAGHTLRITDDGNDNTTGVTSLGAITTVTRGGGTLIFDLQNGDTELEVGNIGNLNSRITAVEVWDSGKKLEVGNIFAGTLTINRDKKLTAKKIDVETLTNIGELTATDLTAVTLTNTGTLTATDAIGVQTLTNEGDLTIGGGTIDILGGTKDITSTGTLTIGNTAPEGFSGNIEATNLTVYQGWFDGDIDTTDNFTARLGGDLTIKGILTVGGNAIFKHDGIADTENWRVDLGTVKVDRNTTIDGNITVFLDLANSTLKLDGVNTLGKDATLVVYGELDAAGKTGFDEINLTGTGKFVNQAIFTDYQWDGDKVDVNPNGPANMSDGYLAALTMHHRYTAWNMVRDRLVSGSGHSYVHGRGYRGQADCQFCEQQQSLCDCVAKKAWGNVTGRYNTYRSSFNNRNWCTTTGGGQVGVDLFKFRYCQTGLLFGYEDTRSRNAEDRLKANDCYFGFYGAHLFRNGTDGRVVFAHGWQDYNLDRLGNGGVLYQSSFKGRTSEVNVELGRRLEYGGGCSLRPVLAVDMYNNNLKAAEESGRGDQAVRYDKTSLSQVFLRAGTDLRHRTKDYTIHSGVYYAYDVNGAELKTIARSAEKPNDFYAPLVGTKLGRSLLMFNLGAEGEITPNFLLFLGYQGEYATDSSNGALHSIGNVGFIGKW